MTHKKKSVHCELQELDDESVEDFHYISPYLTGPTFIFTTSINIRYFTLCHKIIDCLYDEVKLFMLTFEESYLTAVDLQPEQVEDVWRAHLPRPLIPDDPLARHCSLSLSTGSEHSDNRRLAFISISRSCLEVPAITDGADRKCVLFKGLIEKWIKRLKVAEFEENNVCVSLNKSTLLRYWSGSYSQSVLALKVSGLSERSLRCHWDQLTTVDHPLNIINSVIHLIDQSHL